MNLQFFILALYSIPTFLIAVDKSIFDKTTHIQEVHSYDGVFVDGRKLTGETIKEPSYYAFYVSKEKTIELSAKIKKIISGNYFLESLINKKTEDDILLEYGKYFILSDEKNIPLALLTMRGRCIMFSSVIQVGDGIFQNDPNNISNLTSTINPFKDMVFE